jgi:catechol 2,3-dioxygenase-like lactoylglutathione lyase family enzyme
MNVRRIHHAGIPVSNLARSLSFYERVFGCAPDFQAEYGDPSLARNLRVPDPRMKIAMLTLADDVKLELLEYTSPAPQPSRSRDCDVGATHVCLEVSDIEAAYDELRAKGVDVYAEPYTEPATGPFSESKWLFFKDPDGVSFELNEQRGVCDG